MALPAFAKLSSTIIDSFDDCARLLGELQQNAGTLLDRLARNASLDSLPVKAVVLTGGVDTVVSHKLGRVPQEWWVTRINAAATIFDKAWTSTTITLRASATVTIDFRVA